jgi:hypothetical protein
MTAQKSRKRSPEETRSRQRAKKERGEQQQARQHRCATANVIAGKLKAADIRDMQARKERGEVLKTIGKAYGLDEFTVARVLRYGQLTPWQAAEAKRAKERASKQEEWLKRHPRGKESSS